MVCAIACCCGASLLTWLHCLLVFCVFSGKRFHYKIKRCDSTVVADQFLYNHDDKLVVTLRQSHLTYRCAKANAAGRRQLGVRGCGSSLTFCVDAVPFCLLMLSGQRLHAAHEEQEVNRTRLHPLSLPSPFCQRLLSSAPFPVPFFGPFLAFVSTNTHPHNCITFLTCLPGPRRRRAIAYAAELRSERAAAEAGHFFTARTKECLNSALQFG